ncbi:hypothetical protein NYG93_08555 [Campylobacter felis]|uniref:ADP-ribosyltransferase-containing protein n=1 Tax=Campylobacter felis TaxID=2974565 RepID=UPI00256ACE33|nr:hypothetical protein [Campylobacter felis]
MLSDKAIQKSINNGFSKEDHLRAVEVVDELFKRAKKALSKIDEKDKNLSIYRYNAPFENANALMTLKEYKQNGKRIYSLELESLEAVKFNPSGKDLTEQSSKSKDVDTTTFHTPIDNPSESIAQKADDFGVNFEGFKGKEAVLKLLEEKRGQVKGAFYKEGLGDIDVVWGDENFGLRHIIEKHGGEFEDIALQLSEAMENGVLKKQNEVRSRIEYGNFVIGLSGEFKGEKRAFIITAFNRKGKSSTLSPKQDFTDKSDDVLSNQESIIPQQSINSAMEKSSFDEKKAKDLLEWHKNSHTLTKDADGLPKVFYHGSKGRFQVFKKEFDKGKTGFWFADRKIIADDFAKDKGGKAIYPVFLKMKNPIWLTYQKEGDKWVFDWLDDEGKALLKEAKNQGLSIDYFQKDFKFKEFLQSKGYDGIVLKTKINGILQHSVFDSNQIKHIDNKGSFTDKKGNITKNKPKNSEAEHKYFNENSENIYYSNPHLGAGLAGGVLNGVEQDEEGNLSFDPVKFAMGFLGASLGSKAVRVGFKHLEKNPALKEKIIAELADTLALGFEKAREKYPLLSTLKSRYIVQNERGRKIQAKVMLKNLLKLAPKLKKALGLEFDEVFLTKKDLSHFRTARKANYNQALSEAEMLEIPSVITHAKNAYIDTRHKNFFIVFADKKDNAKINFIHFNADELGNYIITTKKADKKVLNDKHYKQVGSGIEPHIP